MLGPREINEGFEAELQVRSQHIRGYRHEINGQRGSEFLPMARREEDVYCTYSTDEATTPSAKRRAALRVANLWRAWLVCFARSIHQYIFAKQAKPIITKSLATMPIHLATKPPEVGKTEESPFARKTTLETDNPPKDSESLVRLNLKIPKIMDEHLSREAQRLGVSKAAVARIALFNELRIGLS